MSTTTFSCGVSLRQLLPHGQFIGIDDLKVQSCCADAFQCREGDVFVAKMDENGDGHELFDLAVERGAAAIIAERLLPTPLPQVIVDDTRVAFASLCHAISGEPASSIDLIGITGSYGKTTTQFLLAAILECSGHTTGMLGSMGHSDGCDIHPSSSGMTEPATVAKWLAESRANGCTLGIVESSSQALAQRHLSGLEFRGAVVTNVRREHVELHGSTANYRRAKRRLLESLTDDGFAILNADDSVCQKWLGELHCPVLTYGIDRPAELTATIVERHRGEQTFLLEMGNDIMPVRTKMIGKQHVQNCLAAAGAALVIGVKPIDVVRGLESLEYMPGRMQRIEQGQSFGVFLDGSVTPEAVGNALLAVQEHEPNRVICVAACDSPSQPMQRSRLGRVVERFADVPIISTGGTFDEDPLSIAHEMMDGFDRPAAAQVIPNREKAIRFALSQAQANDVVLICGNKNVALAPALQPESADAAIVSKLMYEQALINDGLS